MGLLSKLFGKGAGREALSEPLVPVPIPALGVLLLQLEKHNGTELTEEEVIAARDKAVCMMMRVSQKQALEEKRGYRDINPERAWEEWQAFRREARPDR